MEFIDKFKSEAKSGWDDVAARYAGIKSPAVRLAVLVAAIILAVVLFFHFLPWIVLLAVIGGIGFAIYCAVKAETDG